MYIEYMYVCMYVYSQFLYSLPLSSLKYTLNNGMELSKFFIVVRLYNTYWSVLL